jgi:hypothetical protein
VRASLARRTLEGERFVTEAARDKEAARQRDHAVCIAINNNVPTSPPTPQQEGTVSHHVQDEEDERNTQAQILKSPIFSGLCGKYVYHSSCRALTF